MIEIIARDTCPTCGGKGYITCDELRARGVVIDSCYDSDCIECPEPRVLATFADAAELRAALEEAFFVFGGIDSHIMTESMKDEVIGTIEDRMGVSDDHA